MEGTLENHVVELWPPRAQIPSAEGINETKFVLQNDQQSQSSAKLTTQA